MSTEPSNFATLRKTRADEPMAVSPSRAIAQAGRQLTRILQTDGPHAIGFCVSHSLPTETHYVASKFAKGSLRTARLFGDLSEATGASGRSEIQAIWLFGAHDISQFTASVAFVIFQDDIPSTIQADIFFPAWRGEGDADSQTQSKPDWWWVQQVARAMGFNTGLQFASTSEIHDEMIAHAF